jgi:hypothetical protein
MNYFKPKTSGEYRFQRTGSYVDENALEIPEERYKELNKVINTYLEEFILELENNKELIPIEGDDFKRNNLKILDETKKRVTKDLLKRTNNKELTIWESSKISQGFSWETKNFKNLFIYQISDDMIDDFKRKIKRRIKKDNK